MNDEHDKELRAIDQTTVHQLIRQYTLVSPSRARELQAHFDLPAATERNTV